MIGAVVTGHGKFATGMMSVIHLIAGDSSQIVGVDFEEGMSSHELKQEMLKTLERLDCKSVLIFTDLTGGTPFNVASTLTTEDIPYCLHVIAGSNMPMLLELVCSLNSGMTEKALVEKVKNAGISGIVDLNSIKEEEDVVFEDGL